MSKSLTFIQIILAALIGSLGADIIKSFADQCVSRDNKGCAETRVRCVINNLKTPGIIPSCLLEKTL